MELECNTRECVFRRQNGQLGFDNFDDFAALVFPAMRAGPVGTNLFVAVWALRKLWNAQGVVRTSSRGTALRMSAFGIRHVFLVFLFSRSAV